MVVKRKMGTNQQFSLRWNNYLRHITCAFDSLRSDEDLVDVTLSCEGKRIRAHKMLLSACSSYFRDLFKENPCQHPVIIFRNVKFEDLAALVDFMYQGEVNVVQDQLSSFLTTAELLAVQGLSDGNGNDHGSDDPKEVELPDSPLLPPEPEVQLSNNTHGQKQLSTSSSVSGSVSSPVSFFPVDQRPDSPPCNKRRKWGGSVGGTVKSGNNPVLPSRETVEKDGERERETERRRVSAASATSSISKSSQDPIEIIPVPNLKLEMPDYMEQEQDASSCSYSDSNQGGGGSGGGQGSSRDPLPPMSQLLAHGTSTDSKQEPSEMYSTNSGDSTLPPSAESLSASDIKPRMEFSSSQKGNKVLTFLGFEYLYFRTINGVLTWRCRQSRSVKCNSIMKTKDGNIVQPPTEHCHDSCPQKAEANIAKSKMRSDTSQTWTIRREPVTGFLTGLDQPDGTDCYCGYSSLTYEGPNQDICL
ncbi:broad-complex core protein isoforms 1/2/3/4/5-like isoform X7 [Zootermopsis nevadensis]|uniref:broad-complex core protein isoforms 1/2/3/4/5-like isoform X7 n=1 Tax=Zootermopsis nevadensis TaxID=136037 RepID=UPI000B8E379C|nr:broad-complex core protein isoforms 1/2/3/4/5-like isoform X7 [Zootermopsis nevadensis]